MRTARIPLLRVSLLSCALSAAFFISVIWVLMAVPGAPPPPAAPADCVAPPPAPRKPSQTWLQDYLGTPPPPGGGGLGIGINGIDGIWWPPGQAYQYVGRQLYFDGSEVSANNGFEIVVPDGELWRINWIAVDWITNSGSGTRFFVLNAYDFLGTGFGYYVLGTATPTDNDGGTVTWQPGVNAVAPVTQKIQEPLPRPLFLYSQWHIQIQLNNGDNDFLNSLRADIERWIIVGAPTSNAGPGPSGAPSPIPGPSPTPSGGPYFVGPIG